MKREVSEKQLLKEYSPSEIDELAEWFQDLTLKQAFFLKESFEAHLKLQAQGHGSMYVH